MHCSRISGVIPSLEGGIPSDGMLATITLKMGSRMMKRENKVKS